MCLKMKYTEYSYKHITIIYFLRYNVAFIAYLDKTNKFKSLRVF